MNNVIKTRVVEDGLRTDEVSSFLTPINIFEPLKGDPRDLGFAAHASLESLLQMPIASKDFESDSYDELTGQRAGIRLGDVIGRQKEFTKNLPQIKNEVRSIADAKGVDEDEIWDVVVRILQASGIANTTHRTLSRPFLDEKEMLEFVEDESDSGITLIVREAIANWSAIRHDLLVSILGSFSTKVLSNIERVIYAGSGRNISGAELWRPELQPYTKKMDGQIVSELSEFTVAEKIHAPRSREVLGKRAVTDSVEVFTVPFYGPYSERGASGNDVMRAIADAHPGISDNLIIEVGNAPSGYVQLSGALALADVFGHDFDPTRQFVMTTDFKTIVRPDYFATLNPEERSKVQNAATALNSCNGWLNTVIDVNRFVRDRER